MRGDFITNLYVIHNKEYLITELSAAQLEYINAIADKRKYNDFSNRILVQKGNNVICTIKTYFPNQEMEVFDPNRKLLFLQES
jgi:hypothetical protein